jgi:hypothetical protein
MSYGLDWNPLRISTNPMNGVARGPLLLAVGGAAAATWGGVIFGGAAATIGSLSVFTSFLVRAALGIALYALSPKPSTPQAAASGYTITTSGSALDHAVIYGRTKLGGVRVYDATSGANNTTLHRVLAFAGHQIDAFEKIYVNDEEVTIDGSGNVTSPSRFVGRLRIHTALGSDTQDALAVMVTRAPGWTTQHRLRGIAYIYAEMDYNQDAFPNGVPEITAVIRGKRVFDPRTGLTAWSRNAALCIRDYLTSPYGLNCASSEIDDTLFQVAANKCDETVLEFDATEARYTCDGTFTTGAQPIDVLNNLITSLGGILWWAQGEWRLKAASYTTPVMSLDYGDFRSELSISPRTSRRENFNAVKGIFRGESTNWQNTDYTRVTDAAFVTEDNGTESTIDMDLPFTSSNYTCQRLARTALRRAREQITVSGNFSLKCLTLQVGDNVTITNSRYGWTNKVFEVIKWGLYFNEDLSIETQLTLREISSDVFTTTPGSVLALNNTNLPSAFDVATVSISLDESLRLANETVIGVVSVVVDVGADAVSSVEVEYKPSASSTWIQVGRGAVGKYEIVGVSDGLYDFRARAVNLFGVRASTWTTILNRFVSPFVAPPSQVTNFRANIVGGTVHLYWDPVPDLDLSHYRIKYTALTSGATYADAIEIVERVARPANTVSVPAQTGTYFIKSVDKLGTPSVDSASVVVLTDPGDIQNLNVVETVNEYPAFSGTKTNVVNTTYVGNPAITLGASDSGIYQFANVVDLGQIYTSRVTGAVGVRRQSSNTGFDETPGLFDSATGLFDGDGETLDETNVRLQLSYTNDNPAGSPAWSDWTTFFVTDVTARAIRFRVLLDRFVDGVDPVIISLSASVDMPDRVQSGENISFAGSTTVTFPFPFSNVPAVGVSVANLSSGQRYTITGKTRTGFTLNILNSDNSPGTNTVQMDYVAKGYGRGL